MPWEGAAPAGEIAASTANRPGSAFACGGGTGGASVKRIKISEYADAMTVERSKSGSAPQQLVAVDLRVARTAMED